MKKSKRDIAADLSFAPCLGPPFGPGVLAGASTGDAAGEKAGGTGRMGIVDGGLGRASAGGILGPGSRLSASSRLRANAAQVVEE